MAGEVSEKKVVFPDEEDTDVSGDAAKGSLGDTASKSKTTSRTTISSLSAAPPSLETDAEDTDFESKEARTEDDLDKIEWGEDEMDEGEEMFNEEEDEEEAEDEEEDEGVKIIIEPPTTDAGEETGEEDSESITKKDVVVRILGPKGELMPVSEEAEEEDDDVEESAKVVKDVTDEVVDRATGLARLSKLQDVVDSQEPEKSESDEELPQRKGSEVSISRSLSHQLDSIEKEDKQLHGVRRRSGTTPAGGQKRPTMTLVPSEEEELTFPGQVQIPEYPWEGSCSSSSSSSSSSTPIEDEAPSTLSMVTEVEKEEWSRDIGLDLYKKLTKDKFVLKRKNTVLMKRVHEFFKLKKWDIYIDDTGGPDSQQEARYQTYLKQFEEYMKREVEIRDNVNVKLMEMERKLQEADGEEQKVLEEIINRQREVGQGLISDRTGKPISNKILERLIQRQVRTLEDLKNLRTKYIKIRDAYNSKELELKHLEQLGEGLYLKDYEQLRMENQSYCDKIEERDEELTQLRNRATSSIQVLAHIREKANCTANSIQDLYGDLEFTEYEATRNREFVGVLKKQRDELRAELKQLKDESGLLVHKRLVRDFERSLALSDKLTDDINALKSYYAEGIVALERARGGEEWRKSHKMAAARLMGTHRGRQTLTGGPLVQWMAKRSSSLGLSSMSLQRARSKLLRMRYLSESKSKTSFLRSDLAEITKTRPAFFPPIKHSLLEYY